MLSMSGSVVESEADPVPLAVRQNRLGAKSLFAAISIGDSDAVQKITDSGVKLSVLNPPGVLHLLARSPKAHEIVPLLLDLGAEKEIRDEDGNTPLHSFVGANMLQATAELLARGVSINSMNTRQETPLHVAARKDLEDMTALLLAYGADPELLNGEGKRAVELRPSTLTR